MKIANIKSFIHISYTCFAYIIIPHHEISIFQKKSFVSAQPNTQFTARVERYFSLFFSESVVSDLCHRICRSVEFSFLNPETTHRDKDKGRILILQIISYLTFSSIHKTGKCFFGTALIFR